MIEIHDLTKAYDGRRVVDGLAFRVEPGRVTGFLGPNGAGKSTTLRMVLGLDRPTAGTALVDGRPYAALERPLRRVGALLDAQALHPGRTAAGHLRWIAASHALPSRRIGEVLALVGLAEVAGRRIRTFSLGMRQRLGVAAALLGDPAALLLDEPVNGLDAEGTRWIRELLRRLAGEGRAVLVSSHLMAEMAVTADHLVVIGRGRLLADTSTAGFLERHGRRRVRVRAVDPAALAALLAAAHPDAVPVPGDGGAFDVPDADPGRLGALAAEHRVALVELSVTHDSLEEAFLRMTADAVEYRAVTA
ncbi:ABC-2 type transport system ATP-binding protein [Kitasatospora sp. SolWspMP-SS2h]|uniref:ATP-binding cassette domain-containing protein n=1 Tax=Kitasatospora sp. SolWspMP-SS2h TaxID=1305729 RepID=UPI000DBA2BDD|nr:ATP-binding cassette domain-containing protein [Kitasatospora sp. SolWspMP-SS2h]RAJ38941.1 ABC-2 type transport system ATP-binding protein [Kitasatospora sp. SolWspMP-SS2h]